MKVACGKITLQSRKMLIFMSVNVSLRPTACKVPIVCLVKMKECVRRRQNLPPKFAEPNHRHDASDSPSPDHCMPLTNSTNSLLAST